MNKKQLDAKAELNLRLLMWIKIFSDTMFSLGVWLLFYLKFTSYTGVGLIEGIGFAFGVGLEIPAGSISDRFGHRTNLIIFGFLNLMGLIMFMFSRTVPSFIMAVIVWRGAYSFLSGSFEALVHESMQHNRTDNNYQEYISKVSGLGLIAMAATAFIGGFLWQINYMLVYWAQIPFYAAALILSFKLTNFQLENTKSEGYINSLKDGAKYIFKPALRTVIISLFGVIMLVDLFNQLFNAALKVAAGMNSVEISAVTVLAVILSGLSSLVYSKFKSLHHKLDSNIKLLSFAYLSLAMLSYTTSKLATGMGNVSRAVPEVILNNTNIEKINKEVPSKHRSTAISSYSFIKALPYAVFALPIGKAIDHFGVNKLAFTLSLISLFVYFALSLVFRKNKS